MKPLVAFIAIGVFASASAQPAPAHDGHAASQDFATVNLYFMNQWLPSPAVASKGKASKRMEGMGMGMGMGGGGMGMMSSQNRFETALLYLNDKFIGHAVFRHSDVKPKLNLPPGDHKFRVECEGYQDFEHTITVLQNGSVQWLVIKLELEADSAPTAPAQSPRK